MISSKLTSIHHIALWIGTLIILIALFILSLPTIAGAYYLAHGSQALAGHDDQTAVHSLEVARRWQPDEVEVYLALAQSYLRTGQLEEALAAAQEALRLAPDAPESHLTLGDVYDWLDQPEQAVAHYEAGQIGDRAIPLTVNYLRLADRLWAEDRREEAVAIWRDKVRILGYAELYANWRLSQYFAGDWTEATEFYRNETRYFGLEDITPPPDPRLATYQTVAVAGLLADDLWSRETLLNVVAYRVWQDRSPAARDLLQALILAKPNDADLLFYLGEWYHRQGDWSQAEATYQQVLDLDPDYAQAYLRLGLVAEKIRALQEAAGWYKQYYEMAPDDLLGLKKLIETYEVLGKPEAKFYKKIFKAKTDKQRLTAELLGIQVTDIDVGEDILVNGSFEVWQDQVPVGWNWIDHTTQSPFNDGVFVGGADFLVTMEGDTSGRVSGLWLKDDKDRSPGRSGWRPQNDIELDSQQNTDYYALSFFYRTENMSNNKILVGTPSNSETLNGTKKRWHYHISLLRKRESNEKDRPLFFIFAPDSLWIDNISIAPIRTTSK